MDKYIKKFTWKKKILATECKYHIIHWIVFLMSSYHVGFHVYFWYWDVNEQSNWNSKISLFACISKWSFELIQCAYIQMKKKSWL